MVETLSAARARRVFLHAQGLAQGRPRSTVGTAGFRDYLARQGIVQLDSVNVLARAHYLPVFSRLGAYDQGAWDEYLWRSGETFEHWGHEASVMPRDLLPALAHRMSAETSWKGSMREELDRERPGLIEEVARAVAVSGPLTAADIEHLAPRERRGGSWWDHSHVKSALEYLFICGDVAIADRPGFRRLYGASDAVWGVQVRDVELSVHQARQVLFERALHAVGIGTVADIADHYRIKPGLAGGLADAAVESGAGQWVHVEGWEEPALLASGAEVPPRASGAALLSPFDPVCWFRPRLERMFGMRYRIEIYTPAAKREFGYYCLPFLMGDAMEGRLDLKADRKAGVLRVEAAWREPKESRARLGMSKRRSDGAVALALADELRLMAQWLGLSDIAVAARGTLAPALSYALAPAPTTTPTTSVGR